MESERESKMKMNVLSELSESLSETARDKIEALLYINERSNIDDLQVVLDHLLDLVNRYDTTYYCPICKNKMSSYVDLKKYKCRSCDVEVSVSSLKRIESVISDIFLCRVCNKWKIGAEREEYEKRGIYIPRRNKKICSDCVELSHLCDKCIEELGDKVKANDPYNSYNPVFCASCGRLKRFKKVIVPEDLLYKDDCSRTRIKQED